jgi:hypothetical protein
MAHVALRVRYVLSQDHLCESNIELPSLASNWTPSAATSAVALHHPNFIHIDGAHSQYAIDQAISPLM